MNEFRSIAAKYAGRKYGSAESLEELARAYRAVFVAGNASEQQRQVVLVDLANTSEFYLTCDKPELLAEHNGKRKVFERIFHFMSFGDFEFKALERAARREDGASRTVAK